MVEYGFHKPPRNYHDQSCKYLCSSTTSIQHTLLGVTLMPINREVIREMQLAVLRRCEERIEKAGQTADGCYREAGKSVPTRGVTGAMRSRHGL
jgi:hypothetical protein